MPDYLDRTHIHDWLNRLATVVPKARELADLAVQIDALSDLLIAKVPTSLFSPDSLEYCARRFKFWPGYSDLWARLQEYNRAHPPRRPALPAPVIDDPTLTPDDRSHVVSWTRLKGEWLMSNRLDSALSMHRKWPASFAYICRTDPDAAAVAVRRGWSTDLPDLHSDRPPEVIAHIEASASAARSAIRGGQTDIRYAVNRAASEQQIAFKAAQKVHADEQIAKARDANPAVQRARAAQPANTNEPDGEVIPPTKPNPRPAGVTAEEWATHAAPKPTIEGEVIEPATAIATVSGAAWRPPWED
jgi:hypothetical protein